MCVASQVLLGDVDAAVETHSAFWWLWKKFGVMPEMFDLGTKRIVPYAKNYPLRPELAESTWVP